MGCHWGQLLTMTDRQLRTHELGHPVFSTAVLTAPREDCFPQSPLLTLVRDPAATSLGSPSLPGPAPEGVGLAPVSGQASSKKATSRFKVQ